MPADRPDARVGERLHERLSASGSTTESESTNTITSAAVARMPAAIAARLPRFSGKSITLHAPVGSGGDALHLLRGCASVEPSLTATSSSFSGG